MRLWGGRPPLSVGSCKLLKKSARAHFTLSSTQLCSRMRACVRVCVCVRGCGYRFRVVSQRLCIAMMMTMGTAMTAAKAGLARPRRTGSHGDFSRRRWWRRRGRSMLHLSQLDGGELVRLVLFGSEIEQVPAPSSSSSCAGSPEAARIFARECGGWLRRCEVRRRW